MAKKKGGKARRPPQHANRQRAAAQSRHQAAKGQKGQAVSTGHTGQPGQGKAPTAPAPAQPAKGRAPAPATKGQRPAKERSGSTRAERLAAAQRARRRRTLRNRAMVAGVVLVVVGAIVAVVMSNRRSAEATIDRLEEGSCQFDRRSDRDDGPGRNHVPNPTYSVNPPSGGNHDPQAASAGNFTAETVPSDGQIVHAMEHGYVVLWYKPDLPADAQTRLREVFSRHAGEVLLVPRPSLPKPVAATAWGRRLLCDDVEVAALDLFVTSFRDQGPEKGFLGREG
ncbi:MAG TPA: DUF3105 domain-containing protein [Acidimicrobiales bacterium]|nr:DUF3105 domain-containing protein [Acidimicrobiales bacterium]